MYDPTLVTAAPFKIPELLITNDPGAAGAVVVNVSDLAAEIQPLAFTALAVTAPITPLIGLAPIKLTVIVLVPAPDRILAPAGTVQLKAVPPAAVKVTGLSVPMYLQIFLESTALILNGVAGKLLTTTVIGTLGVLSIPLTISVTKKVFEVKAVVLAKTVPPDNAA